MTHYGDYDFESRRPDMIFFHNPYDQFNNMTSVHPFFYSKNLKSFTDMLVYIPYYATSGGMSDDRGYSTLIFPEKNCSRLVHLNLIKSSACVTIRRSRRQSGRKRWRGKKFFSII